MRISLYISATSIKEDVPNNMVGYETEVCLAISSGRVFLIIERYESVNDTEYNTVTCISRNPDYIKWIAKNFYKVVTVDDLISNKFFIDSDYSNESKYSQELLRKLVEIDVLSESSFGYVASNEADRYCTDQAE